MNKFQEIKELLKADIVVQYYLGLPEKHNSTGNWYKSPFRKEKTASLCVSEKGIHDFGESRHYDIISFVQRHYNTTPYQALEILCNDFNINNLENKYETKQTLKLLKQKKEEEKQIKEKIQKWFKNEFQNVCKEIRLNTKCLKIFEPKCNFEILSILYNQKSKLEYYYEILLNADEQTKAKIYLKNN